MEVLIISLISMKDKLRSKRSSAITVCGCIICCMDVSRYFTQNQNLEKCLFTHTWAFFTQMYSFGHFFEPATLESQSNAQKTRILVKFPLKIWVKQFPLAVGAQGPVTSAKRPTPTPLMTSPTKNSKPKTLKPQNRLALHVNLAIAA